MIRGFHSQKQWSCMPHLIHFSLSWWAFQSAVPFQLCGFLEDPKGDQHCVPSRGISCILTGFGHQFPVLLQSYSKTTGARSTIRADRRANCHSLCYSWGISSHSFSKVSLLVLPIVCRRRISSFSFWELSKKAVERLCDIYGFHLTAHQISTVFDIM